MSFKWPRGTNLKQNNKPFEEQKQPSIFQRKYNTRENDAFRQTQMFKKNVYVQPEMIIWLLVRNFFKNAFDKFGVKAWFVDEEICLTASNLNSISIVQKEMNEQLSSHIMDYLFQSDELDLIVDQVYSEISVNQNYHALLNKYPMLLIIKKQKMRKVSLWLKKNHFTGMNKVFPNLPTYFVMVFAPKKQKESIMESINQITQQLKSRIQNNITPGQETFFDLKSFSNYEIKRAFIYSTVHKFTKMQILPLLVDINIKRISEEFKVYIELLETENEDDNIYFIIHAEKVINIVQAERIVYKTLKRRGYYLLQDSLQQQDIRLQSIQELLQKKVQRGNPMVIKSDQISKIGMACDQFYSTSMFIEFSKLLYQKDQPIDDSIFIFIDSDYADQLNKILHDLFLQNSDSDEQFQKIQNLYPFNSQKIDFDTPTANPQDINTLLNGYHCPLRNKPKTFYKNYVLEEKSPTSIEIQFYSKIDDLSCIGNYELDLKDFNEYISKYSQFTVVPQTQNITFKAENVGLVNQFKLVGLLDRYVNFTAIIIIKHPFSLISQQRYIKWMDDIINEYQCGIDIRSINQNIVKAVYFADDQDFQFILNKTQLDPKNDNSQIAILVQHFNRSKRYKILGKINDFLQQVDKDVL